MGAFILSAVVVGTVWTLSALKLERARLTGAIVMVAAGILVGWLTHQDLTVTLNNASTERAVELILALLLFVDATEIRGGFFGGQRAVSLRLLLIGLPLSLVGAVLLGRLLLPTSELAVLLIVACAVVPIDLTATSRLIRDHRVPSRVRHALNVESGYNDGIVAPLFIFALALVGEVNSGSRTPMEALESALPAALIAVAVGAAIGAVSGWVTNRAVRYQLTQERYVRMSVVLVALLTYGVAVELNGNGFVAAFICGIAYKAIRKRQAIEGDLELIDDCATIGSLAMWFLFGAVIPYLFGIGLPPFGFFAFAVAALTVVRIVPVHLALVGSAVPRTERRTIAMLGPRGTASIVFALLAWQRIDDMFNASIVLYATAITVLGSVLIHGLLTSRAAHHRSRTIDPAVESGSLVAKDEDSG